MKISKQRTKAEQPHSRKEFSKEEMRASRRDLEHQKAMDREEFLVRMDTYRKLESM